MSEANQNKETNKAFSRFLIIWLGELFSTIGTGLTGVALGIYAFQETGQATSATLVVLLTFLPAFLLRPIGGVLADRFDRRLLMIIGNLGYALGIALVFFALTMYPNEIVLIYPGVAVSSLFFALLSPAYKATVTDLVPPDLYAKTSGMVQLSGSAQFLLAPLLAGVLISIIDISYIVLIDIITSVFSAIVLLFIRKAINATAHDREKATESNERLFMKELKEGLQAITVDKGIFYLIMITALVLFYTGLLQALFTPMALSFTDARTLGVAQSICAIGMLVSSILIGIFGTAERQVMILTVSLFFMGISYSFIGFVESVWAIIIPGFLFFFTIPFVNSTIEVLIRRNIDNSKQGRAWSLIGVLTNVGAMIAYAIAGFLADYLFNPLFIEGGALASSFGQMFGVGNGRGIAFMFFLSGIFVVLFSLILFRSKHIQLLEVEKVPLELERKKRKHMA